MAMMMMMEEEQVCMQCVLDGRTDGKWRVYLQGRREKRGLYNKTRRGEARRWLWRTHFEHLQARPAELVDAEPHETQVERVEERAHQSA
jgi:hypothetical protein